MSSNYLYRNIVSNSVDVPSKGGLPVVPKFEPVATELDYTNSPSNLYADSDHVYVMSRNNNNTQVFDKFSGNLIGTWSTPSIYDMWSVGDFVYYVNNTSFIRKLDRFTGASVANIDASSFGADFILTGDNWGSNSLAFPNKSWNGGAGQSVIVYLDTTNDTLTSGEITTDTFLQDTQAAAFYQGGFYEYLIYGNLGSRYVAWQDLTSSRTNITTTNEAPRVFRDNNVVYITRGTSSSSTLALNMQDGTSTSIPINRAVGVGFTKDNLYITNSNQQFKRYDKETYTEQEDIVAVNPSLVTSDPTSNAIWWQELSGFGGGKIFSIQEFD